MEDSMMKVSGIALMLFATTLSAGCYAQQYNAEDVLAFTRIASVAVSPDGKQVAFVSFSSSKAHPSEWQYTLSLEDQNSTSQKLIQADYISFVNWSPDGKSIAFIATENGQQTLSVYQLANQRTLPVVTLSRSMTALNWSPSGREIAFVASAPSMPEPANGLVDMAQGVVNSQLYLVKNIQPHASFQAITPANISISDSVFGGGFSWSLNNQNIAFTYQPSARATDDLNSKLAVLDVNSLKYTTLPFCENHTCGQPFYSPDHRWLAFASSVPSTGKAKLLREDIEIQNQICLMDNGSGQTHCLQNTFNGNPYLLGWKPDSQAVYVVDMYKSEGPKLYELSINSAVPAKLISTQPGFIEPLTLSINNTNTVFGFSYESINTAPEVFTAPASHFKLNQITQLNQQFDKPLGKVQVLNWTSKDGTSVEGLLITPINYNPKKKYPLYVDVHGGPTGTQFQRYLGGCDEYAGVFPPTTCAANILSLGYVILQVNYRGSNGYGVDFRVKNFGDLGGGDYNDVMSGFDQLIERGIVDPNKVVIAGWSYGGYLSAWAISQSDRFAAAIDGDGFTDFISYTGASDDHDFFLRYLGSYYWDGSHDLYWSRSPIAYVNAVKTPLLILQGEQDVRVPMSQAQELYTALNILNRPVKMLIAPNQSHEPTDPDTAAKEIDAIDEWLQSGAWNIGKLPSKT
jgi:dipeptidyl aminopeptidase/acylaminoacyl peptidase